MSTPKHRTLPGSSYFVTTKCWQGRAVFQVSEIAETLLETLFTYRDRGSYLLHEFVIMPDHLHLILTPSPTVSLEKAMQCIKGGSSHRIHQHRGHKMEIWQVGFYDSTIRDYNDWQTKVRYIHENPARARLVDKPQEWPYSSGNGRFRVDPIPAKYLSSGAKALVLPAPALGLKPQPPKEQGPQPPKGQGPRPSKGRGSQAPKEQGPQAPKEQEPRALKEQEPPPPKEQELSRPISKAAG